MQTQPHNNGPATEAPLSRERYIHLWDHAISLFQIDYEWLSAMDLFEFLAEQAPSPIVRAMLLLNVGIIRWHLADYSQVQQIFQKVLPLARYTSPLAHFLLGLARFDQQEYEPARISFRLCSVVLQCTSYNHDYRPLGLDFVLTMDQVLENEETAAYEWAMENKKGDGLKPQHRLLHRLPASLLFSSAIMRSFEEAKPKADTVNSAPRVSRSRNNSCASLYSIEAPIETTARPDERRLSVTKDPPVRLIQPPQNRLMVPREACAESPNLRLMAHFLKHTGPESSHEAIEKVVNKAPKEVQRPRKQHVFWGPETSVLKQRTAQTPTNDDRVPEGGRRLLRKMSVRTLSLRNKTKTAMPMPMHMPIPMATMAEESEESDSSNAYSAKASSSHASRQSSSSASQRESYKQQRIERKDWYTNPRSAPEKKKIFDEHITRKEGTKKDNKPSRKSMDSLMMFSLGGWL